MKVSKDEVKQILDTLPISYYLGRSIAIVYDTISETSYFSPVEDVIHISFNNIYNACIAQPDDVNLSIMSLESIVRTILYHEISHVILTPIGFIDTNHRLYNAYPFDNVMNIIEDERIETVLANYYHDVDFNTFKRLANHYDPHQPITSAEQLFYVVVRFHDGPAELVLRAQEIIHKYLGLTCDDTLDNIDVENYWIHSHWLYKDCEKYFNNHPELQQSIPDSESQGENQPQNLESSQSQTETQPETSETESQLQTKSQDSQSPSTSHDNTRFVWTDEDERRVENGMEAIEDEIENESCLNPETILNRCINRYQDENLKSQFDQIFRSYKQHKNSQATSIPAYSGRFNPRLVGREDYKMWTQKNSDGSIQDYSKVKLNLFVDNSGSMHKNEKKINILLYNLYRLQKECKQFNFDVVLLGGYGEIRKLESGYERYSADGGTWLSDEIFKVSKQVQAHDSTNINIVMFDGEAFNIYRDKTMIKQAERNFSAFNNSSYTLIIEESNYKVATKYCPKAKIINTQYYFNTFMDEVLKTLMQRLK